MQVERKWHILMTVFFLLITSGQCMDSKDVKQKERRTLLDLILQVIRDSQQREKGVSRRCSSGHFTSTQDMKFSSREKPLYVPRLDNSRLIGKLIRFIFRSWWWKHNPNFTSGDSCHQSGVYYMPYLIWLTETWWPEEIWKRKLVWPVQMCLKTGYSAQISVLKWPTKTISCIRHIKHLCLIYVGQKGCHTYSEHLLLLFLKDTFSQCLVHLILVPHQTCDWPLDRSINWFYAFM